MQFPPLFPLSRNEFLELSLTRLIRDPVFFFQESARKLLHTRIGGFGVRSSKEKDLVLDQVVPGKGNSNTHGKRPVHLIITIEKWLRTSRLSIKDSLSACVGLSHNLSTIRRLAQTRRRLSGSDLSARQLFRTRIKKRGKRFCSTKHPKHRTPNSESKALNSQTSTLKLILSPRPNRKSLARCHSSPLRTPDFAKAESCLLSPEKPKATKLFQPL